MSEDNKIAIVEAIIFASPTPVSPEKIARIASISPSDEIEKMVVRLNEEYSRGNRAFRIKPIAGGYQFFTLSEFAPFLNELFSEKSRLRLTRAMLETLSIIALKQPVTKPVIEKIRGADSSGPVHSLLECGLITIKGRQKMPGRPFVYGTTDEFLRLFGLHRIEDLPGEDELAQLFGEMEKPMEIEESAETKSQEE